MFAMGVKIKATGESHLMTALYREVVGVVKEEEEGMLFSSLPLLLSTSIPTLSPLLSSVYDSYSV